MQLRNCYVLQLSMSRSMFQYRVCCSYQWVGICFSIEQPFFKQVVHNPGREVCNIWGRSLPCHWTCHWTCHDHWESYLAEMDWQQTDLLQIFFLPAFTSLIIITWLSSGLFSFLSPILDTRKNYTNHRISGPAIVTCTPNASWQRVNTRHKAMSHCRTFFDYV